MLNIDISFGEAIAYLTANTWMNPDEATIQIKTMFHSDGFYNQIKRPPTRDELTAMAEYARKDRAMAYQKARFQMLSLRKLAQSINKTSPINHDKKLQTQ